MSKAIHKMKNGIQYVYESTSYWDKKKKAPRTKQNISVNWTPKQEN